MRVLLYHFVPFALAHGGQQIQIVRTRDALRSAGVDAEFLDWHREDQAADILHVFGRPPHYLLELARIKGMRTVISDLFGAQGARPRWRLQIERFVRRLLELVGRPEALPWTAYRQAAACVALTSWEAGLLRTQFRVPAARIHLVPNGVDEVFFQSSVVEREPWLLCVATIAPVKRVLELAQAALLAQVPIRFIGKPYSNDDPYVRQFKTLVEQNPGLLQYLGTVDSRSTLAGIYRRARGMVLLSQWESLSLAALEAAACDCPLLLSDLPWARASFGRQATYCPLGSPALQSRFLREFHSRADTLPRPPRPATWEEIGHALLRVYQRVNG
jgi:glycosyltransferase involved in cell wall biosynthesis